LARSCNHTCSKSIQVRLRFGEIMRGSLSAERARNLEKVIDQHKREMERTADIFSHMRES
ncbi:hypothetical protein, partial [Vibrio cincinnatiensis]|uniref:hypothetical protein n=1 Tax=Vibrio cincinnatiensis TaxID=675 RepID=UPI001EDEDE6E